MHDAVRTTNFWDARSAAIIVIVIVIIIIHDPSLHPSPPFITYSRAYFYLPYYLLTLGVGSFNPNYIYFPKC
jgi:hypothetical protein